MDMDDDDFMGEIEFDLSPEQGAVVMRAVNLASANEDDEFGATNPLIAIMQWWEAHRAEGDIVKGSPEGTLVEACRRYIAAHERR